MKRTCNHAIPLLILSVSILVLGGCSDSAAPRDQEVNIRISLSLSADSGRPGDKIVALASVQNIGRIPVLIPVCCTGRGVFLQVLSPDGQWVCHVRYCDVLPLCPCHEEELRKETLQTTLEFDGTLWEGGEGFPAPAGEYTIRASFVYRVPSEQQVIAREEVTFLWDPEG